MLISGFSLLLFCQMLGEIFVRLLSLPIPGPVVGMIILLCFLRWRGRVPEKLQQVSQGLLSHLALLFVPAGVGVVAVLPQLRAEWLPITASIVISTLLAIAAGGLCVEHILRRLENKGQKNAP